MFTGIILAVGQICAIEHKAGDCRLTIDTGRLELNELSLGDSVAVNGVCLTAVTLGKHHFCADVSIETLSRTTLNNATIGQPVNLELAMTPSTRMGGHIVSGHVDGIGTIIEKKPEARSFRFRVKAPANLAKYIAEKGSICIDGISLTVNEVDGAVFGVNIVPHTLKETTLGITVPGTQVNLEVDLLARYMERLLLSRMANNQEGITQELLQKSGFLP